MLSTWLTITMDDIGADGMPRTNALTPMSDFEGTSQVRMHTAGCYTSVLPDNDFYV